MPRRFDLVICDIDGCLTPEHPGPLDAASLSAIAEHNRRAERDRDRPMMTLCSGRPQPFVELLSRLICNFTVPCIAENGVWLYHPGTNSYEIDPAIEPAHTHLLDELRGWLHQRYDRDGAAVQPGKTASLSLYHANHDWLVARLDEIRAYCSQHGIPVRVSMSWFYINCDLAYVSKATGIERLLRQFPLDRARIAGIGDTEGDRAIAERVGFFACPANAEPKIRPLAQYVAPSPEAAGVVEILARLAAPERAQA